MFQALTRRLFGSANDRTLKALQEKVARINELESSVSALDDDSLKARTPWLREQLANGASEDTLLPEAFATVREAARRTLGQRHYDTQLMGGMVLHEGRIAEMATGEGKTLVSTLPLYLNALSGKGAHLVTVNDYLAQRDAEWMGAIYRFLGLNVACITHGLDDGQRHAAYAADITYATNNELGFDYLRDNMKFRLEEMVQRPFNFAIIDEVDSILIDEARTPLIISGPAEDSSALYTAVDPVIQELTEDHYEKDEKLRNITLTDGGVEAVEASLRNKGLIEAGSLFDVVNISLLHHVNQALRAHKMFTRDVDYIVKDDRIVIIDEFTGRMMEGRRFSEGLHQALEAKEKVTIQNENQTLASITFQNFFRLYPKLAGMTGTAITEAGEFMEIYNLDVTQIPTNRPVQRLDHNDEVYATVPDKDRAILAQIKDCRERQQPVLVGTVSIEKSEHLSNLLSQEKIPHQVLNARHHDREAAIIAQAGVPGAVTIATNMAGRGTDIQLGGNADMRVATELSTITDAVRRAEQEKAIREDVAAKREVALKAGGLFVLGTERHESRRIDNQLRGRSGRQGDPGTSRFYLSLKDDLMRIFVSDQLDGMLRRLGFEEGEPIAHPWVNKALEKAQRKVEARNFDIRKNLLKYDNVMNDQRKVVYEQRRELMQVEDISDTITDMRLDTIQEMVTRCIPPKAYAEQWDVDGLHEEVKRVLGLDLPVHDWAREEGIADEQIHERLVDAANTHMAGKAARYGPEVWRSVEKSLLLQLLDQAWKDHLLSLDHLRQGVGLRAYAQRDPLNEYQREAFDLFDTMLTSLRERVTQMLAQVELEQETNPETLLPDPKANRALQALHANPTAFIGDGSGMTEADDTPGATPESWGKVSRNAPCPCGSGKKYKHCHGRVA